MLWESYVKSTRSATGQIYSSGLIAGPLARLVSMGRYLVSVSLDETVPGGDAA